MRVLFVAIATLVPSLASAAPPLAARLQVPPGFHVTLFSKDVPNARELALGANGTVFVGSSRAGKVYSLTDADHDGVADKVRVVASGLRNPIGVAFHGTDLYVSAVSRILVLRDIEAHLDHPPAARIITDKLPDAGHHGGRFIGFGPDARLYVPIGAPCNICERKGYAKLLRMNADGSHWQDVAHGIRNTVGFDWQPGTNSLWFTDNGRDMLGDNEPSDELNRVTSPGQNFGFPFCHQGDILDPQFGHGKSCADYVPPVLKLGAHVAALGMAFYAAQPFPARYHGAAFIAEHGSWNRSKKVGYRVTAVFIKGGKAVGSEVFLSGFLDGQRTLGRPVDVLVLADGSMLVSDDRNGAIYRIAYTPKPAIKPTTSQAASPAPDSTKPGR